MAVCCSQWWKVVKLEVNGLSTRAGSGPQPAEEKESTANSARRSSGEEGG